MRHAARIGALLVTAILAGCGGHGEATDLWENAAIRKAKDRGKLVVATEPEFPPFEYKQSDGTLAGFDIDLARVLAAELGVEVEFLETSFDSIINTLKTGKADLIISGMTATPDRALSVSYTDPYFHTVTCLLVSKERAPDLKGVEELDAPNRVISVKQGTTGDIVAHKRCPKAKIVSFQKENDAAMEVALGRADAFLFDLKAVENHHERHPDRTFVIRTPVSVEPYAIACQKGDPETVAWLNLVLLHLRRDGRLKELYEKHDLAYPEDDE